ncbi:hypothetical protein H8N03_19825 [Ramlibacter sp. USB13]|uniref:Uncharacterized protein n=1 Tax=Ramlibacter cellulosilyticus TaxID=2764187 RepID=A0A923MUG1_9BURK|nr:hypothetical protein [Ramlibacter cellulosilyticus]MBC5785206.1 hypothetical protein [Ramlibacter cellulosilyticus]
MNPQDLFSRGWWIATGLLAAVGAWVLARLRRRRTERHLHVARLAAEIVEVARSIEADLQELPRTSEAVELARRCGECRRRTTDTASRRLRDDALEDAIGQLHDDHRRVVDLRSEVDVLMVAKRSGQPVSRELRFARGTKPGRSRFTTTGLLTRPSSLG